MHQTAAQQAQKTQEQQRMTMTTGRRPAPYRPSPWGPPVLPTPIAVRIAVRIAAIAALPELRLVQLQRR